MNNSILEADDVARTVDDMDATDRSRNLVQGEWSEGRVERGLKYSSLGVRIDGSPGRPRLMPVTACKETITALCCPGLPAPRCVQTRREAPRNPYSTVQYSSTYRLHYCTRVLGVANSCQACANCRIAVVNT